MSLSLSKPSFWSLLRNLLCTPLLSSASSASSLWLRFPRRELSSSSVSYDTPPNETRVLFFLSETKGDSSSDSYPRPRFLLLLLLLSALLLEELKFILRVTSVVLGVFGVLEDGEIGSRFVEIWGSMLVRNVLILLPELLLLLLLLLMVLLLLLK